MDKKEVTEFFDFLADSWDGDMIKDQRKIDRILDAAEVVQGSRILDVACGTGVLIPDYIKRKVQKCVAVDISSKMIEIAIGKFGENESIEFVCADAEQLTLGEKLDCVIIYNAFPHFVNPCQLFENLSGCLKRGGRITVAHGMGREELTKHHSGAAEKVSTVLPEADILAEMMSRYFKIDVKVDTDEIYIVSGTKTDL